MCCNSHDRIKAVYLYKMFSVERCESILVWAVYGVRLKFKLIHTRGFKSHRMHVFIFLPNIHSTSFHLILVTSTHKIRNQYLIHISTDIISKHNPIKHSPNNLIMFHLLDCDSIGGIVYIQLWVIFFPREEVVVQQSRAMGCCNGKYNRLFIMHSISR